MKALRKTLSVLLILSLSAFAGGDGWLTNIEEGLEKAKKENKSVLVEFTGSDWCPPCIMMKKKVFSKEKFVEQASEKYVLVEIDIPRGNPELSAKNEPILDKYGVRGVPTVILMDAEKNEFDRFTASAYPSVSKFIEYINSKAPESTKADPAS